MQSLNFWVLTLMVRTAVFASVFTAMYRSLRHQPPKTPPQKSAILTVRPVRLAPRPPPFFIFAEKGLVMQLMLTYQW